MTQKNQCQVNRFPNAENWSEHIAFQNAHLPTQTHKSVHLMLCCLYFSGFWLEIPALSPSPVILDLIRWLDAVNIPFYLDLYPSFDLLCVLLPIECMLLIAVFSCIKRAFVLTSFFLFFSSFAGVLFFMNIVTEFSVKLSLWDVWTLFTRWRQFYIWLD